MKENNPSRYDHSGKWRLEDIVGDMDQQPQPTADPRFGNGWELRAFPAPASARSIEFYSDESVIQIDTPNLHVELYNASSPYSIEDGVHIEDQAKTTHILFLRNGHVLIEVFPSPQLEAVDPSLMAGNQSDEDLPDLSSLADSGASDNAKTPSQETSETPQTSEQEE